jgi:hypothetical protein
MRVKVMEGGFAPFLLLMRSGSNSPRGSITVNLHEVQAISRPDIRQPLVGVLIGGCWVYGLLTDQPHPSLLPHVSPEMVSVSVPEWEEFVNRRYDELGNRWAQAKTPMYIGDPDG